MRKFLKPQAMESKNGSDLALVECRNVRLQLADKEILIGDSTLKALLRITEISIYHIINEYHAQWH